MLTLTRWIRSLSAETAAAARRRRRRIVSMNFPESWALRPPVRVFGGLTPGCGDIASIRDLPDEFGPWIVQ
jgi:hypothetical protein